MAQSLAAWDDDALAELANKGLVRRARKDVEAGKVAVAGTTESGGVFEIDGERVELGANGPQAASCTCPAQGACRHILAAVLHAREATPDAPDAPSAPTASDTRPPETPSDNGPETDADAAPTPKQPEQPAAPPPDLLAEVLALDIAALTKWAGKPATRGAIALLDDGSAVEYDSGNSLVIRLTDHGTECRYIPGGGPDGMISKQPTRMRKTMHLAALLAVKRANGQDIDMLAEKPVQAVAATLDDGERRFIDTTQRLLRDLVSAGLSHLSTSMEQRLATLAVSARGEGMPRLAAQLRALTTLATALRNRDASGDETRLFVEIARCHALCTALKTAEAPALGELRGSPRSKYAEAGKLSLIGLGAHRWRTESDSQGLTTLFWNSDAEAWNTATLSRTGANDTMFSPSRAYDQSRFWAGVKAPREASRSAIDLSNAKLSPEGRLSLSGETKGTQNPLPNANALMGSSTVFDNWETLAGRLRNAMPAGLKRLAPQDSYLILRPAKWGTRNFNPIAQRFHWVLHDAEGQSLAVEIGYSETTERRIDTLERLNPGRENIWGVVAAIRVGFNRATLEPLSLLGRNRDGGLTVLNPDFPEQTKGGLTSLRDRLLDRVKDRMLRVGVSDAADAIDLSPTQRRLQPLSNRLQGLAETGQSLLGPVLETEFQRFAETLRTAGFDLLAQGVEAVAGADTVDPEALIRLNYLLLTLSELDRELPVQA